MKAESRPIYEVAFAGGGKLARRSTCLLSDGTYFFQDLIEINGIITTEVITCTAWLVEFYHVQAGELVLESGDRQVRVTDKRVAVLYPPFSITRLSFRRLKAAVIGLAAIDDSVRLPGDKPRVFDIASMEVPCSRKDALGLLKDAVDSEGVPAYPNASLLSLKAKRLIDENYFDHPAIGRIAGRLGVTAAHLSRQFKSDFRMTPTRYLHKLRLADTAIKMAKGEDIISVSENVGYNDLSRFYKQFRKHTRTSPGACRSLLTR